jgi:hypothetical protein
VDLFLPLTLFLAAAPSPHAVAAPLQDQPRQCWFDAMSDAEKRELVHGYVRVQRGEGKERAAAWAQAQREAYVRRAAAQGVCPQQSAQRQRGPAPSSEPKLLNRHGKPCTRIELENQNVPNIGGSMGWALVQVCKD